MALDVTEYVKVGNNDDELLPLFKCVCGKKYGGWGSATLGVYEDSPWQCDECGRQLFFRNSIKVFQVTP